MNKPAFLCNGREMLVHCSIVIWGTASVVSPGWRLGLAVALTLAAGHEASAHHSVAVFFDATKSIQVTGTVTEFRFSNPHGIIAIEVTRDGRKEVWRAETNSPALLRRQGWTRDILTAGEVVTVDGWPSRDGSNYMRMRRVTRANGTVLPGGAPAATER